MAQLPIPGRRLPEQAPGEVKESKIEERLVTNTYVEPPITIKALKVFSFKTFNQNVYLRGGQALQPDLLTALEKGHVYRTRFEPTMPGDLASRGPGYLVTSLRIVDEETAELLSGLEPFNGDAGMRLGRWAEYADNPKAFDFTFWLQADRFLTFRERAQALGGRVFAKVAKPALNQLQELYEDTTTLVGGFNELFEEAYRKITSLSQFTPEVEFVEALKLLDRVESCQKEIFQQTYEMTQLLQQARAQPSQQAELVVQEAYLTQLSAQVGAIRQVNVAQHRTEIKTRLTAKLNNQPVSASPAFNLQSEVTRLRRVFPVLNHLQVASDQEVLFEYGSIKVRLGVDGIKIEGNEDDLLRLAQGVRFKAEGGGGGGRFGDI